MNSLEAFQLYSALKAHFNEPAYDFFRYDGRLKNVDAATLARRSDQYHFQRLTDHYDVRGLLVAHFLENPDAWIGDILNDKRPYLKQQAVFNALTHNFRLDLTRLNSDFDSNFKVRGKAVPPVLTLLQERKINLETVCILCEAVNCFDYWDRHFKNNVFIAPLIFKIRRYLPFFKVFAGDAYVPKKFKDVLLDFFETNNK